MKWEPYEREEFISSLTRPPGRCCEFRTLARTQDSLLLCPLLSQPALTCVHGAEPAPRAGREVQAMGRGRCQPCGPLSRSPIRKPPSHLIGQGMSLAHPRAEGPRKANDIAGQRLRQVHWAAVGNGARDYGHGVADRWGPHRVQP